MMPPPVHPGLIGREAELGHIGAWADLLDSGPAGLVVSGEAGIGKTTVWSSAVEVAAAHGARVLVSRPVEAELPLAYAGLGDLLADTVTSLLPTLPDPQSQALAAALSTGTRRQSGDPLLVGRALQAGLRRLADDRPVVIAVDDVNWLDGPTARALAFALRRLGDARVGVAVSLRIGTVDPVGTLAALAARAIEIRVEGLSFGALGNLLRSRVDPDLPRRVLRQIHERSAGNPFFAIQLAAAGERGLPSSLQQLVRDRLAASPGSGQALETVAVLGPLPLAAFADLGGVDAAVAAGLLVETEGSVRFAHPLLAAGAYDAIPPGRRRALHRDAADVASGPEERARHLALAATDADGATADLVDRAARSANERGAPETAADLASYAVRLTPPGEVAARARRMMDRAEYLFRSADEPGARELIDRLLAMPVGGVTRVRALAQLALSDLSPGSAVAHLEAAVAQVHDDRPLAIRTLAQLAWQRGSWLGDLEPAIIEGLEAVARAEELGDPAVLATALTTAGQLLSIAGRPGAADRFRRALSLADTNPIAAGDHSPRIAFAHERWWRGDYETAANLLAEERRRAEASGDEATLMRLNVFGAHLAVRRGRWDEADALVDEALVDARGYWRADVLAVRAIQSGRRGDSRVIDDVATLLALPAAEVDPILVGVADFARGLLDQAHGDIHGAAERMAGLPRLSDAEAARGAEFAALIPEAVAALVQADRAREAQDLVAQLERRRAQLMPWGVGAEALCRGMLALGASDVNSAASHLLTALHVFEDLETPWELGQTLITQALVMKRMGRRRDAAAAFERAETVLEALGAEPARRRAGDELRRARPRPPRHGALTAAEAKVAAVVATGRTNREVAASLFTTVTTVEAHLTRIYAKLGIRSRSELAGRVSNGSLQLSEPEPEHGVGER